VIENSNCWVLCRMIKFVILCFNLISFCCLVGVDGAIDMMVLLMVVMILWLVVLRIICFIKGLSSIVGILVFVLVRG